MAGLPHNIYRKQALVAAIATWLAFIWLVLMVDPTFTANVGWKLSYLPFFILVSLAVCLTLWGLSGRWKRSGLWTLIITVGLWLRLNQLDSIINTVLLLAFGLVWEYYWKLSKANNLIN